MLHLLFNPAVNLALAEQYLVDHLANDLAESTGDLDVETLTTYRMVEQLVRQKAATGGRIFQFALCLEPLGMEPNFEDQMVLLSPALET
jgi:hypothetical protein